MPVEAPSISVLICTHNRRALLARTITSLNDARRPHGTRVELLVVANACTDDTHAWLAAYAGDRGDKLPLRWIAEPTPGKSHALNRAFDGPLGAVVAFVDDDHRVDAGYLEAIAAAAAAHPDADLFCGRILPDWDGSEPRWVHDDGPYRIYPLPVPRFDLGDDTRELPRGSAMPGGGNLAARHEVIRATGRFATDLGPIGHDLGGGEDLDWVRRALLAGARLRYAPKMVQFHYVERERLQIAYLLRKSYQRSKAVSRVARAQSIVPLYMWRKLVEYLLLAAFAFDGTRRRFYLVRLAAALGEIRGVVASGTGSRRRRPCRLPQDTTNTALAWGSIAAFGLAQWLAGAATLRGVTVAATVAALATLALAWKSVRDFSQTGPRIRDEILRRYRAYTVYAVARLAVWLWLIFSFFAGAGVIAYATFAAALGKDFVPWEACIAAVAGIAVATFMQASRKLFLNPGLIVASWQYRLARLTEWRETYARRARSIAAGGATVLGIMLLFAIGVLARHGAIRQAAAALAAFGGIAALIVWAGGSALEPSPRRSSRRAGPPNILMIGSDTLRADRILNPQYPRDLAPNIRRLARHATLFTQCYVPCARTAPSLISMFSGTWPHTHGVRDNFVADSDARLLVPMLPQRLRDAGFRTITISDWCGADFAKFPFGFDTTDVAPDQWNLKYLIRQGPKDLRLLLSLFCHNRFGRRVLPEIYYLGGVPQTDHVGRRAREMLSRIASSNEPFMLNVFFSTTHPPFASEWPYFERYAASDYRGESKFAMARLSDPFDIIRRQGDSRREFDLQQIIDLYDGCVDRFDHEVGRLLDHLAACGLEENTIVALYGDHGMEFFEHDTWGQGNSAIGDFSARVPFLVADPRLPGAGCCEEVVRTIDIAPTLLDLAGCDRMGTEGVSLRSLLEGGSLAGPLTAFNETGIWITDMPGLPPDHLRYPDLFELLDVTDLAKGTLVVKDVYRQRIVVAKDRMIRRGNWKLVFQPLERRGKRLQLFDLARDPGCTRDLAAEHTEITAALWSDLLKWISADASMRPEDLPLQEIAAAAETKRVLGTAAQ